MLTKSLNRLFAATALCLAALMAAPQSGAQEVALKTNLLDDAFLNVNLGAEMQFAPRWTADLSGSFNAWTLSDGKRWKHRAVQPEARYWFCNTFAGHFVGIEAHGGQYNIGGVDFGLNLLGTDFGKLKDSRYQGWFVGGGVTYGYSWILNKHWNIEAEIGVGYSYTRFDRYPCAHCGTKLESDATHHYVGITKAAINLVYGF